MSVVPTPIFVMSGFSESNENSAVHLRDDSSGQRTVKVSAEAETVMGPGRTPEMSAGTMPATLRTGMRKMSERISIGLGDFILTLRRLLPTMANRSALHRCSSGFELVIGGESTRYFSRSTATTLVVRQNSLHQQHGPQ